MGIYQTVIAAASAFQFFYSSPAVVLSVCKATFSFCFEFTFLTLDFPFFLVCTECVDNSTASCVMCDLEFDVDNFQKFQPGFRIEWLSYLDSASNALSDAVESNDPDEILIEVGPIIRPITERRKTKKFGDGHVCEYDFFAVDGCCVHCLTEHDDCNLLNTSRRCTVCHRCSIECPKSESKSFYLVERILSMLKEQRKVASIIGQLHVKQSPRHLKVIVFSQFRNALNVIGDRLLKKFGTACVAEYFGRYREQELHKFVHKQDCFILLLTKDGSEGLDLSFVTNIVFLEQIYDKSLQNQAVARAWRMGATGPVEVETLIASNTVEEVMHKQNLEQPCVEREVLTNDHLRTADNDARRVTALLLSLHLNTDYHHFGQSQVPMNHQNDELKEQSSVPRVCSNSKNGKRRVQFQAAPVVHCLNSEEKSTIPNNIERLNIEVEQSRHDLE